MDYKSDEKARMLDIIKSVGKKLREFVNDKNNICLFVFANERVENDLFVSCVYAFDYNSINSKKVQVVDDRKISLKDAKKEYDGIITMKCITNCSQLNILTEIDGNVMNVIWCIKNEIFKNEDGFCECFFDLGFD